MHASIRALISRSRNDRSIFSAPSSAFLILLAVGVAWAGAQPPNANLANLADLRSETLLDGISREEAENGRQLLERAQRAWGLDEWKQYSTASFEMTADWKLPDSGWPGNPQRFRLHADQLGKDDAWLEFLDGPAEGKGWGLRNGQPFDVVDSSWTAKAEPDSHDKVNVKNWWFQFPFRIAEADVLAAGGRATVAGKEYETLFATWSSPEPNAEWDHYVLYLDPESLDLEWLAFTYRGRQPGMVISTELLDYETVQGMRLPGRTVVHPGPPGANTMVVHENTYHEIRFDQ